MALSVQAGSRPSRFVKSSRTPVLSSRNTGPRCPAMTTSELSQPTLFDGMELESTSSVAGSRARISAWRDEAPDWQVNAPDYGANMPDWLANYDPASSSWKTSQHCLVEGLETFSGTFPRSGMMQNGIAYRLPPLVHLTDVTDYGSWPTPRATDGSHGGRVTPRKGRKGGNLIEAVSKHLWPTPTRVTNSGGAALCKWGGAGSRAKLSKMVTPEEMNGALNPEWVEWLMGFPPGWTEV